MGSGGEVTSQRHWGWEEVGLVKQHCHNYAGWGIADNERAGWNVQVTRE